MMNCCMNGSVGTGDKKRMGSVPTCGLREVGGLNQRSLAPWLLTCGGAGLLHGGLFDCGCPVGSVCERGVDGSVCGHVDRMGLE